MKIATCQNGECRKEKFRVEQARMAFFYQFPSACVHCEGSGFLARSVLCECVMSKVCPRCGRREALLSAEGTCLYCGFQLGQDSHAPAQPKSCEGCYESEETKRGKYRR